MKVEFDYIDDITNIEIVIESPGDLFDKHSVLGGHDEMIFLSASYFNYEVGKFPTGGYFIRVSNAFNNYNSKHIMWISIELLYYQKENRILALRKVPDIISDNEPNSADESRSFELYESAYKELIRDKKLNTLLNEQRN